MKVKKTIFANKSALISLVSGLALAGFGAYKAIFGKDEADEDCGEPAVEFEEVEEPEEILEAPEDATEEQPE